VRAVWQILVFGATAIGLNRDDAIDPAFVDRSKAVT
jgi:hypothetical protein